MQLPQTWETPAIFGRRPVMLGALILFALGSALVGAAQNMAMVLGGRSVQGVGGRAVLTMVRRLVPPSSRSSM
jgi:MFS family permease